MKQRTLIQVWVVLLIATLLLVARVVEAASVTVSAGSAEAQPGGTVEIPIQLAGANGLGAVHLEMTYDPRVLTAESAAKGALAGNNALLESNTKEAGRVVIGLVTLDGIKGDGVIATARFKVIGDAGTSSDLKLENNQAWERESHAEVLVNTEAGKVTIAAGLPSWLIPALAVFALLLLLLFLFFVLRRRRPAPQPAYNAPAAYTPSANTRPASAPVQNSAAPPMDLPERRASTNPAVFQRAEDEYFKLKGQLGMGRITQEQFEQHLRELMVQDTQGNYWMLGADTGKWYAREGDTWVERKPY